MSKSEVKLTLSTSDFNLIMDCLRNEIVTQEELLADPVVKVEDKGHANEQKMIIERLIRELE